MNNVPLPNKLWTPEFIKISLTNLIFCLQHYILIVALPIFIINNLNGDNLAAGMAMTFFQLGAVTSRPFAGLLIDCLNKKRLLIIATLAVLLVMLGFYFLQFLTGIYTLRLLNGVLFALGTTVAATIAVLIIPPSRKGEGLGYFALSTNLAMVIGPLLGLVIISNLGANPLFFFLTLTAVFTLYLVQTSKLSDKIIKSSGQKPKFSFESFLAKESIPWSFFGGLVFFAYGSIITFIPLYARELGLQAETSLFFTVYAAVIVITRPIIGRVFDGNGPDYTIYPGFFFFAGGMFLFGNVKTLSDLLTAAVVLGIGFGALSPAFQTLSVRSVAPMRSGVATATYFLFVDISIGLAAAILAQVAEHWSYATMYGTVCTTIVVLNLCLYFIWTRVLGHK